MLVLECTSITIGVTIYLTRLAYYEQLDDCSVCVDVLTVLLSTLIQDVRTLMNLHQVIILILTFCAFPGWYDK